MANLRSAAAISGPPMGGKPRLENGEANGNENGKEVEKANERQEPAQPMTQVREHACMRMCVLYVYVCVRCGPFRKEVSIWCC